MSLMCLLVLLRQIRVRRGKQNRGVHREMVKEKSRIPEWWYYGYWEVPTGSEKATQDHYHVGTFLSITG